MKLDLLDYQDLPTGTTRGGRCPSCGRRRFYVTRKTDGLAYICFRASCGTQGFVADYATVTSATNAVKPRKNYEWTGETVQIDFADQAYFVDRFQVDLSEDSSYWVKKTTDGRYVFPLWGTDDKLRGHVVRRATWGYTESCGDLAPLEDDYSDSFPKALTYIHPDEPRCGWYHAMNEHVVVMVEDCVSAMRIAQQGYTAVALLGTYMPPAVMGELLRWKATTYILALDPDVQDKAYKIQRDYGGAFPDGLRVVELQCDPKDYDNDLHLLQDLTII